MSYKSMPTRLMPQTRWIILLLLAVMGALLWWGMHSPLVDGVKVRSTELVRSVQFSARVSTLARVEIGSTVTARVAQVLVREGAQVREGDILVRLESDELRAILAQAQAAQIQAQAKLQGLRSTGRVQAQAALAQALATVHAAQADVTRTQQLVTQGFLSPARLDEAQRALAVARAVQDGAAAQVQANTESGTDVGQAQAQFVAARAAVEAAQARLQQAVLRAPTDARVLLRSVEQGQIVQPGRALLSLALMGPTQIKAQVDERFLAQLAVGQSAAVVADAFADQRLAAHVSFIAPAVDAQRGAVEVTLTLENAAPAFLREDMTLSIEVETAHRSNALTIPLAALRSAPGSANETGEVLVAVDGRVQLRTVRLGVRSMQAAEVVSGLNEGDMVILGANVVAGQRVRTHEVAPPHSSGPSSSGQSGASSAAMTNAMGR